MPIPDYVRRGGLDVSPPPWKCDDIDATIFYIAANPRCLQALCDRTLNEPSGPHPTRPGRTRLDYRPTVDWIALTFQHFTHMHSTAPVDPGSPKRETHTYSEAAFWIMVEDANGIEMVIPYMFIDDGTCMAAGREIYGFPKEFGTMTIPIDALQSRFAVEALAVGHGAGPAAHHQLVLECVRTISAPLPYMLSGIDAEVLWQNEALTAMKVLYNVFLNHSLSFVFLRQFRALAGGASTDLQQVTAARAYPFEMHPPVNILTGYELHLPALTSHHIASDLGFAPGPVPVPFGFQCKLSFILNHGMVL